MIITNLTLFIALVNIIFVLELIVQREILEAAKMNGPLAF